MGHERYGAANWISLLGFSFQPSELAKICYIFAGAATLERLFRKRNLGLFILLTGACMGCLALMSDFGTAAIFFVTFLVIAYLRSGDYTTLALICGGAVFGGLVLVTIKPYILRRFAAWGHVWEQASDGGFQQTRTMSAAASGGLIGVGPGEGWLHRVSAADTDLVFGMLCEEWGLIIALLSVACIAALAVFAVRSCRAGRSSFYTIAACPAPHRGHLPLCVQRRVVHAVRLGAVGLFEGGRHPQQRQLRHPAPEGPRGQVAGQPGSPPGEARRKGGPP